MDEIKDIKPKRRGRPPYKHLKDKNKEGVLNSEEVKNKISDQVSEEWLYGKNNDLFKEFIKLHRVINISLGNKLFPIAAIDTDKFKKFCNEHNLECDKSFEND